MNCHLPFAANPGVNLANTPKPMILIIVFINPEGININKLPSKTNFACLFEGYFEIVEDGYYYFAIVSNDGAKLFLGNKLIIDNDGVHATESVKSFVLPLKKGFYPVRAEYFQKDESSVFQLLYLNIETMNATNFPFKFQYNMN